MSSSIARLRCLFILFLLGVLPAGCGWYYVFNSPRLPDTPRMPTDAEMERMSQRMMGKSQVKAAPVTTDGVEVVFQTGHAGGIHAVALSPNGRYIAFEFHPNEHSEIYIVEVPGGVPHLLPTNPGADNLSPSWSRDGKWLYFSSKRGTEAFQIWKLPMQGGIPVQVTRHGGISAVESADGRYLYYSKFEQGGVWRMPIEARDENEVLDVGGDDWPNWALTSEGIYFFAFAKFSHPTIQFLDFASGKTHPVLTLERKPGWGLSVSNDGKSLIYTLDDFEESNLMMVENFK